MADLAQHGTCMYGHGLAQQAGKLKSAYATSMETIRDV